MPSPLPFVLLAFIYRHVDSRRSVTAIATLTTAGFNPHSAFGIAGNAII